ncbi:hypothetical protein ACIQ9J_28320 [Streptomyces sp. NPDC094153]
MEVVEPGFNDLVEIGYLSGDGSPPGRPGRQARIWMINQLGPDDDNQD